MFNIKELCKTAKNTWGKVVTQNPLAAALMLGNLYHFLEGTQGDDKALLQNTISEIKSNLLTSQAISLWNTITKFDANRYKVMGDSNKETLNNLMHHMVQDIDFFKHIPAGSIIDLGQNIEFYREALIALIRNHLHERNENDPFSRSPINYSILKEGGSEQNSRYLGQFVKQCNSFPVDNFVLLGAQPELASFILLDLHDTSVQFELGKRFSELHPSMRKEVATVIQNQINTLPLSVHEATFCETVLPLLAQQFPEFQRITTNSRVRRDNRVINNNSEKKLLQQICEGAAAGMVLSYVLPAALAPVGFAFTVPAILVNVPLGIGFSFGFNILKRTAEKLTVNVVTENPSVSTPRSTQRISRI